MDILISPATSLRGSAEVPADKAICHRAVLLSSLADGDTVITPWSTARDCERTRDAMRQLGVPIDPSEDGIRVRATGRAGLRQPAGPIDCGESGTTMRLLCGLLAGLPFKTQLDAAPSLGRRPMRRIVDPLSRMGARITGRPPTAGTTVSGDIYPPLSIEGRSVLTPTTYRMPVPSAQVKPAILLAALSASGPSTVSEPSPTRDHTERLLERLGIEIRADSGSITVTPPTHRLTAPGRLSVPGDFSSAAFFIVAGCIVPGSTIAIRHVGLNPTRMYLLDVLRRMGANIRVAPETDPWEPRGTIELTASALRATDVRAEEMPLMIDELPVLMVAASVATGDTTLAGLAELRVKETDRIQSMVTGLQQLGVQISERGSADVVIRGGRLRGGAVESFGDHRTAMSLAVAGLVAEESVRIAGAECVAKSFGNFFRLLAELSGESTVRTASH